MKNQEELENLIGYHFQNPEYLTIALTHSSFANEVKKGSKKPQYNERLEFLGDAVLELASSQYLFRHYPDMPEGDLSKLRASLVCEQTLALSAKEIDLGEYLRMGKGEELTGGRHRDSVTSDAFEAVIGALYLDGGLEASVTFVERYVMNDIEHKKLYMDCKTNLQEYVQSHFPEKSLKYVVVKEEGPDHNKKFTIDCKLDNEIIGHGIARTKKNAQQQAAYMALRSFHNQDKSQS